MKMTLSSKHKIALITISLLLIITSIYLSDNFRHMAACIGLSHGGICMILSLNISQRFLWFAFASGIGVFTYKVVKKPSIDARHTYNIHSQQFSAPDLSAIKKSDDISKEDTSNERTMDALKRLFKPSSEDDAKK